jgi:hypothetical protein
VPFTDESLLALIDRLTKEAQAAGRPPLLTAAQVNTLRMERPGSETGLLRSDRVAAFSVPPDDTTSPLLIGTPTDVHRNAVRNPYFAMQPLQRLGNLVTTRSNVYAIWLTVGFFEVDPITGELGYEVGWESGEIRRHRAFYVIDRSIPVAYEPGANHNVDRAILLRRTLE